MNVIWQNKPEDFFQDQYVCVILTEKTPQEFNDELLSKGFRQEFVQSNPYVGVLQGSVDDPTLPLDFPSLEKYQQFFNTQRPGSWQSLTSGHSVRRVKHGEVASLQVVINHCIAFDRISFAKLAANGDLLLGGWKARVFYKSQEMYQKNGLAGLLTWRQVTIPCRCPGDENLVYCGKGLYLDFDDAKALALI